MQPAVIAPPDSVSRTDTLPSRWPGRPVLLDGAVTYLRETPATTADAEPALYVHGLGGSSANWTDPADLAREVLEVCFADPGRIHEQRMAEAIEETRLRYDVPWYMDAYVRTLRGLVGSFLRAYLPGAGSLWRVARRIQAPTLVIGGALDRLVDVRVAPQVARAVPDSRLLVLDGVGHVAQMEVHVL